MRHFLLASLFLPLFACAEPEPAVETCLEVILTGTQGGPPAVNGLAGAGTLVRYGSLANQCNDTRLQFDVGRGTTMRLSQLDLTPNDLDAIFLTHMHSDHTEGLIGLMQLRWHFTGGPIDLVCGSDIEAGDRTLSCRAYSEHIGDAFVESGEIAQRRAENSNRHADGPAGLISLLEVPPSKVPKVVWTSGDVTVSAITVAHIPGSLAYRVSTPAGSVVIGGDAGNSVSAPPRVSSTSEAVEILSKDADILVHSAIHPVFGAESGSTFPAVAYFRQSNAFDLGAMADRAGIRHLVFSHLIPSLDAESHGPFGVPGGPLGETDFAALAQEGGFDGEIHVGGELRLIRLTNDKK